MSEPEPPTNRWVADAAASRRVALALLLLELKQGRLLAIGAVVAVVLTALFVLVGRSREAQNPVSAVLLALALASFLVVSACLISLVSEWRKYRRGWVPGLVLTTRFGPDHLMFASEWAETRLRFDSFDRVRVVPGWVLLKQRDRRVEMVFPAQLIPPEDLIRLREAVVAAGA